MEAFADMENWMRVFAANHAAGNWDSFGARNSQNLYGYLGRNGTRYSLMMWDFNIVFGNSGSWGPGAELFTTANGDANMAGIYTNATFRRMYWRALEELINGPLDPARSGPMLDAKYAEFAANGISATTPDGLKTWISQARTSIAQQLAAENAAAFLVHPAITFSNNVAIITGEAPVRVKSIEVNGRSYPLVWTSVRTWRLMVPVQPGNNLLTFTGVNRSGQDIPGVTTTLNVTYLGPPVSASNALVISEIHYNPSVPNTSFVELYNRSTNILDLSGFELRGVDFQFPGGALAYPTQYLVVAENPVAFASAYGISNRVNGTFLGSLQNDGETLTLLSAGTNAETERIATRVRYSATAPWPAEASNTGRSLQLRDLEEDNWRVANWAASAALPGATPGRPNQTASNLPPFQPLWINELQVVNRTGLTNRFGQRSGWLEIFNPTTNTVSLAGLFLATNSAKLNAWPFPSGSSLGPKSFRIVWADAQPAQTTTAEWHANFTLPASGRLLLSRLSNGEMQVLDYVDYPGMADDRSYCSVPDAQSFNRKECFFATPAATNNPASPPVTVFINEWMADNSRTLSDPADNDYEDWFELYNPGTNRVDLGGFFLTDIQTNRYLSEIPNNGHYTIPAGGYLLVWADGERGQNSTNRPHLHVNFKLDKASDSVGLYAPDGTPVDVVAFSAQTSDVSEGLFPNGSFARKSFSSPTPGAANVAPNTPPSLAALPNVQGLPGQWVSNQALGQDTDQPPQLLTYSLLSSPPGASINPYSGLFTWQPWQAPASNQITVLVTDSGLPPLTATQHFLVFTLPLPNLSSVLQSGSSIVLSWPSIEGQLYQLEAKGSLDDPWWTNVGPAMQGVNGTLAITNSIPSAGQQFLRLGILKQP
jgi:hypothetical protein